MKRASRMTTNHYNGKEEEGVIGGDHEGVPSLGWTHRTISHYRVLQNIWTIFLLIGN